MPTRHVLRLFAVLAVVVPGGLAWSQAHPGPSPDVALAAQVAAEGSTDVDVSSVMSDLGDPDADVRLGAGKKLLEHTHALAADAEAIAEAVALVDPLDAESDVRRFGRRALLRIGNAALPAAVEHLPDDDELLAALAEPGDTASIEPLIGLIAANKAISREADGWSNQSGVKQALLLIGPEEIAAPLTKALRENRDSLPLLVAVSQMAGPEFAEAAPLLAEYLSLEDEGRCVLAANALVHIGKASLGELSKALQDRRRRAAALYAIEQLGPQAASLADPLFELIKNESPETNEIVLAKFGKIAGELTVGELAERALVATRPPADRFLGLRGFGKVGLHLDDGTFLHDESPFSFDASMFRADGRQFADRLAHALSRETTASRSETRCRRAVALAAGDSEQERVARRQAIAADRFYRVMLTALWSRVAAEDPRLAKTVAQLIEEVDHHVHWPYRDGGCGGIDWTELLFLREAVQRHPEAHLPRLREMLRGDDVERTKALYLYANLGPYGREAVEAAYATLASESYDARRAAALALEEHAPRSKAYVGAMVDRLLADDLDEDFEMRLSAFQALDGHREFIADHVPRMLDVLALAKAAPESQSERYRARRAACVLTYSGASAAAGVPLLIEMTKSAEAADREAAMGALGAIAKDADVVLPALAQAYRAARGRKLEATELYDFTFGARGECELGLIANAIGRYGAAAASQVDLLAEAALREPEIAVDPKTNARRPPDVYEERVAIEAAIALGRIGPAARAALPRLRNALCGRNDIPELRARHLALAIAVTRIDGAQAADLAAIGEFLRAMPELTIDCVVAEELAELGKSHAEIGLHLRRHFLRLARAQDVTRDSPTWYSIYGQVEEMTYLAPFVHAMHRSDAVCCRALEDRLSAHLRTGEAASWELSRLIAALDAFDARSPRLVAILKSAADHDDPETRWRAAAMLERIAAGSATSPTVKSRRTSARP